MADKSQIQNTAIKIKRAFGSNLFTLLIVPLLFPVGLMVGLLVKYGVSFPYSDEWIIVPTFQHIDQGHFSLHDFWQPGSFHRLFFTKILITIFAYLTHWDIRAEMYLSFIFCIVAIIFIYLFIRRSIKNTVLAFLAMLAAAFWIFSPVQSENWLWGWDVAWFICAASAIASMYLLISAKDKHYFYYYCSSMIAAVLSTFSFGWGQAIWPVGLLILLVQKQRRKPILIWCFMALLVYAAYYHHLGSSGGSIPILSFINQPINAISYYLVLFGRPFTNDVDSAMLLGSITLLLLIPVLLLVWDRRKNIMVYLPWLSLIAFSLLGAIMIILGRMTTIPGAVTPLSDAMQSRYTAMPLLYYISFTGLIFVLVDNIKPSKKIIKYVILVVIIIQVPLIYSSYSIGILSSHQRNILMVRLQKCSQLPTASVNKDCFTSNNYRNSLPAAREQLQFLKSKHWAGY